MFLNALQTPVINYPCCFIIRSGCSQCFCFENQALTFNDERFGRGGGERYGVVSGALHPECINLIHLSCDRAAGEHEHANASHYEGELREHLFVLIHKPHTASTQPNCIMTNSNNNTKAKTEMHVKNVTLYYAKSN